jgi:hypothetical protein
MVGKLLLVAFALIVSLTVAEIAARLCGLGTPILYETALGYRYRLVPGQRAPRFDGATVTVNRAGLRATKEWSLDPDERILFVGDSITYGGSYIDDSQLFSEVACPPNAVCGNAGMNAYGVINMAQRIASEAPHLKPTTIVVTLFYGDTLRGEGVLGAMAVFEKPPFSPLRGLTEGFAFAVDELRNLVRFIPWITIDLPFDDTARVEATRALGQLFHVLRNQGARVLLIYSPLQAEVVEGRRLPMGQFVFDALGNSGFPVLDALQIANVEMFHDNVHLTVKGHHAYGEAIGAWLRAY